MHRARALVGLALVLPAAACLGPEVDACSDLASGQPVPPIRAAFYYPWFPEKWTDVGTHLAPSEGPYSNDDPDLLRRHVDAMEYGGFAAAISSWWGPGDPTDRRLPGLLDAARGRCLRWAAYVEGEGYGNPDERAIAANLSYLAEHYFDHPAYLRVNDRPVVFVYGGPDDSDCGMADRWHGGNRDVAAYLVLKMGFAGFRTCGNAPHGWHAYGPATAYQEALPYSVTVSPGFWHVDEAEPRLGRDLPAWRANVAAMARSGATFHLVTTFNEWGEGTSVESAREWATPSGYGAYLDVLHDERS